MNNTMNCLSDKKKHVILIADDDPDDQYLLRSAMTKAQAPVELICLDNGQEVIDYLQDLQDDKTLTKPELVFLDLNMPIMDGRETLRLIKQSTEFSYIPVIIYTTSQSPLDIIDSYRLGANSYVIKPVSMSDLVHKLELISSYWFNTITLAS